MNNNEKQYIDIHELAARLKVAPVTIRRWKKLGLPAIKITHKKILYEFDKVIAWMEERNNKKEAL